MMSHALYKKAYRSCAPDNSTGFPAFATPFRLRLGRCVSNLLRSNVRSLNLPILYHFSPLSIYIQPPVIGQIRALTGLPTHRVFSPAQHITTSFGPMLTTMHPICQNQASFYQTHPRAFATTITVQLQARHHQEQHPSIDRRGIVYRATILQQ